MNKEIILELIIALKTLEDISRRRYDSIITNFILQYDINLMLVNYMNEILPKIRGDLSTLMEKELNLRDLEKYSIDLNTLLNGLTNNN